MGKQRDNSPLRSAGLRDVQLSSPELQSVPTPLSLHLVAAMILSLVLILCSCTLAPPQLPHGSNSSGLDSPLDSPVSPVSPGDLLPRRGDEISVCGQLFHTDSRVILWNDPLGYDAYRLHRHFDPEQQAPSGNPERTARFGSFRGGLSEALSQKVRAEGWQLADLQQVVHQVVLHYDGCGTSKRCFEVLHDIRGLSCHFMVDVDGTIYQTLDLKERAWHAAHANDYSVGIEIANVGAYEKPDALAQWYRNAGMQTQLVIPEHLRGHLDRDSRVSSARPHAITGAIHGVNYTQYDFTDAQYQSLVKLLATLTRVLPRIRIAVPRDATGQVLSKVLPEDAMKFEGWVGHYHLTRNKRDPGPAFDWERLLNAVRLQLE